MIIVNISEWIVQLFVLGLALIFWCIGLFFLALLIDVYPRILKETFGGLLCLIKRKIYHIIFAVKKIFSLPKLKKD